MASGSWIIADNKETLLSTKSGPLTAELEFIASQPLLWSKLVAAGIDPLAVNKSLGFEWTKGNGIHGGTLGIEVVESNGEIEEVNISGNLEFNLVGGSLDVK